MHSYVFKVVLEILARHSRKFIMLPDIIEYVLSSYEGQRAVNELKHRGHHYRIKPTATDREIKSVVGSGYRLEVALALSRLRPQGCVEETKVGKDDSFQGEIHNLGKKTKKGEPAYRITELGLQKLKIL